MRVVEQNGANRLLIGFALVLGALVGVALFHSDDPHYDFVGKSVPIRVAELKNGTSRGTLRIYNVHKDWRSLLGSVMSESPMSVSKVGTYHGLPAETVVVPQIESGRAKLFDTPIREITVIQGKFYQDKSGMEIARKSDGTWAGVRVVEIRQPHVLDLANDWIQDRLRV